MIYRHRFTFTFLLAAGITASAYSTAHSTFTDSLHYRLVADTAVWNEQLGAYTLDVDFQMRWDIPDEPIRSMVAVINFNTTVFRYLSDSVDSSNWPFWYAVVEVDSSITEPGTVVAEWNVILPVSDSSRTTGDFVRYSTITFIIDDQISPFEGSITFDRDPGNHANVVKNWNVPDSNYIDGTPIFLGITESPCCNSPGDANNNGQFNIADVTHNIARIFAGGTPAPCLAEADADANATLNIADVTFMIARIFAGGQAPSCVSTIP